ncbi:hypothetical protein A3K73_04080, partial [Candidatus Pacearchaeota archaeon RBG_13_36_9]
RLGSKLKIVTKTKENKNFNTLELNWQDFEEDQKKEFQSIPVKIDTAQILDRGFNIIKDSGTVVEIYQLREKWDREKLQKLKRYLQRLINPLQVNDAFQIFLKAEDFQVQDNQEEYDYNKVNGSITNRVYETLGLKTTTIDCKISEDGKTIKTTLNDKGVFIFEFKEKNDFDLLKNIEIKISFLNRIAKTTFTKLMGVEPVNYGNIFVFKNGFRVMPLGDYRNDWLGLDIRKGQGYKRTLGTRELLGRVEINGYQENFREIASREGLMHTHAFDQLIEFVMEKVIKKLEKYVIGAIYWDALIDEGNKRKDFNSIKLDSRKIIEQIAGNLDNKDLRYNEDLLQIVEKKTIEKIPETVKNIENIIKKEKDKEIKELYNQQIQSLKLGVKLQKKEKEEEAEKREIEEKKVLFLEGVLSQDTKEILGLQHQIKTSASIIQNRISYLKSTDPKEINLQEYDKILDSILIENEKIRSIVEFITQANYNMKSSEITEDLVLFIKQYIKNVNPMISKKYNERELDIRFENEPEFIKKFKPLEITIILGNLISNSRKANSKNIEISFNVADNKKLLIHFKDDGDGIPKKYRGDLNKIFEFGETTTHGSGIGLYFVKEILKRIGGNIRVNIEVDRGAEFILEIPK